MTTATRFATIRVPRISAPSLKSSHRETGVAEAWEMFAGGRTALNEVIVTNKTPGDGIATSQALAYRTRNWCVPPEEDMK